VATTSAKHMRAVMPGKAADLTLSVGFRIGGRSDGEVDRYVVHVADGTCTIETSPPEGQRRDAKALALNAVMVPPQPRKG